MVDPDRVQYRLEMLRGYRRELLKLRDMPTQQYLSDHVYAGRYLVQVAAQACIDIGNHVIASERWRSPRDFGDTFTVLCENGVVGDGLAGRMRGLAGLRRRLVHVYDDIDDELVHRLLSAGLPDLDAFATAIAQLVAGPR